MGGDFKNPHNFKLISDKIDRIPDSPLLRIGLVVCSGQHYAAAVDPVTMKNYVLYADVTSQGPKFGTTYRDIIDDTEHQAVSDYFLKVGVFEMYYRARNWVWNRIDGVNSIPPWFKKRYPNIH